MHQNFSGIRQLACVMFTDIVGFSALMAQDEDLALAVLKKNRDIQRPIIQQYGGKWIKELGDGVLATFSSATGGVYAAAAIQDAVSKEMHFQLRIGLHISEVVFENEDVFGDGVNIAARLQAIAKMGGIMISDIVQKNIANKKGIETRLIGDTALKNIKDRLSVYEVILTDEFAGLSAIKALDQIPVNEANQKSIAILPFRIGNNDPEEEYFGDGIAEEILVTLSNIEGLKVIGRSSSFLFKGSSAPLQEIGKTLNVGTILEGSVRKHAGGLRINAQLINVKDGSQLWAERYDRELIDIFVIQDDIASKIASRLRLTFLGEEKRILPVKMEAYELLLKGRFYVEKFIEGFDKALACFTRAIEIDHNYAEAYAELAKLHFLFTMNLYYAPKEGFERAKFYAEKALLLNSELGAAHYVLGQVAFWYHWDFVKAKKYYAQAEHATVSHYFRGVTLDPWYYAFGLGDYEGALNAIYKIIETDPLSFYAQLHLAYFYTFGKKPKQALEVLDRILLAAPHFSEAERLVAYNYLLSQDLEQAIPHARKASALAQGKGWSQILLIITLAQSGLVEEATIKLKELHSNPSNVWIPPIGLALIYLNLGDADKAYDYFDQALKYHDTWVVSLKYAPDYEYIHADPRYLSLLKQIGFPEKTDPITPTSK